ncbi:hypothetical protein FACS18949_10830 [Clostridia bacterium]|nr:hypothetical protein FACS18949_10830 [Clostridia bacterium]
MKILNGSSNSVVKWLNLCRKAGAADAGEQPVRKALALGRAELILLASDAGGNTRKWVERLAKPLDIRMDKAALGAVFGRGTLSVVAITNAGLAAEIREILGGNIIGCNND